MTHEEMQAWIDDNRPQNQLTEYIKKTVEENKGVPTVEISTEILRLVGLSIDIYEAKIDELEKKVEDQEERIAIMTEGGWISVKDAMPDDYRGVWVWTKGHLIDFGCHQNDYWLLQSFPSPENDRNGFVTHWQYKMIPEPPKEGEA